MKILRFHTRSLPGLASILVSAALWACGSSVARTPSATYQGLTQSSSKAPYADWLVLPCNSVSTGNSAVRQSHSSGDGFSCTRRIDFDCGSEEELTGFLSGLPAAIQAHFAPAGVSWSTFSWSEGVFSATYVDGPMHGSLTGKLGWGGEGINELILEVEESWVGPPPEEG